MPNVISKNKKRIICGIIVLVVLLSGVIVLTMRLTKTTIHVAGQDVECQIRNRKLTVEDF